MSWNVDDGIDLVGNTDAFEHSDCTFILEYPLFPFPQLFKLNPSYCLFPWEKENTHLKLREP